MRVKNEEVKYTKGDPSVSEKVSNICSDLLEARELIKEMREDLLKISQYPVAFVCEEARIIAREAWKKSKEYAE